MSETSQDQTAQRSRRDEGSPADLARLERKQRSEFRRAMNRFVRYRPGLIGLAFIGLLVLFSIVPQVFSPHDPAQIFPGESRSGPSTDFWLGTDSRGRDVLSRTIWGSRTALLVGVIGTGIATIIGVAVGSIAGYFGGWTDSILSRFVDALMAFPLLALLIVLAAILGPSLVTVTVIIGITIWTAYARVARADIMSLRERDYVLAARSIGVPAPRLIIRHMLPNILGPIIVLSTLGVGSIIILEAALSFLGLGVQPPMSSWGRSLSDARPFITNYPHMAIVPGVMITLTVLAFNLIGDGLRDAIDPRQRE
jgi:peptide/nickel transport system permease protein